MELMAEIPKQVKQYFEEMNIVPINQTGDGQEVSKANANKNRKEYDIRKKKRRLQRVQTDNPLLVELRERFIVDVTKLGFLREDVELVLNTKGLYALDKTLILEMLSAMDTIPELVAEKKAILEAEEKRKADQDEKERKRLEELNKYGDERDKFLYQLPCFAPAGFKPRKAHKKFCKICYENRINCAFMPCKCELFCMDCCTTPEVLQSDCPICGEEIDELVRTYDIKVMQKEIRQL